MGNNQGGLDLQKNKRVPNGSNGGLFWIGKRVILA